MIKEESVRQPELAFDQKNHDLGIVDYYKSQSLKNDIQELRFVKVNESRLLFTADSNRNVIVYDEDNKDDFQFMRMAHSNP